MVYEEGWEKKHPRSRGGLVRGPKSPRESVGAQQKPGAAQSGGEGDESAGGRGNQGRPAVSSCWKVG